MLSICLLLSNSHSLLLFLILSSNYTTSLLFKDSSYSILKVHSSKFLNLSILALKNSITSSYWSTCKICITSLRISSLFLLLRLNSMKRLIVFCTLSLSKNWDNYFPLFKKLKVHYLLLISGIVIYQRAFIIYFRVGWLW